MSVKFWLFWVRSQYWKSVRYVFEVARIVEDTHIGCACHFTPFWPIWGTLIHVQQLITSVRSDSSGLSGCQIRNQSSLYNLGCKRTYTFTLGPAHWFRIRPGQVHLSYIRRSGTSCTPLAISQLFHIVDPPLMWHIEFLSILRSVP